MIKVSIYQPKRKDKSGLMDLFIVLNFIGKKTLIATGMKTMYPLVRTNAVGAGVKLDKREPQGRVKQKRLEAFYAEVEEYCIEHPNMRPAAIKESLTASKKKGVLADTMIRYADSGKVAKSTAEIMKRTARKIEEFDPMASFAVDESWLDKFADFLTGGGAKTNGVGVHLRNIRTVFNYARRIRITKEYPFLDYSIKVERKAVRNMTLEQIKLFKDYPCEPWQVEYRDLFMLMVYLGGINIGDLLECKGLENGRLVYNRKKTDHPISIPVHPAAKEIIEKYKGKDFLINPCDRYKDYHGYMHRMNDGLKKIGETRIVPDKIGKMRKKETKPFFDGMTTYVSRYTFASVAAELGVNRDVIAACLGHSWADVTSHYVAYAQKQIDDAINKVCDAISG